MDISYMEECAESEALDAASRNGTLGKLRRAIGWSLRAVARFGRCAVSVLTYDLLSNTPFRRERDERVSPVARFVRGALYRAAFAPIFIALLASALVFSSTHPMNARAAGSEAVDPAAVGLYYDPVAIVNADDGERLDGWLIPSIDARQVVRERGKLFKERFPAVVLVHDFDGRKQQMLPFAKPLHDAGFTVLILGVRGLSQGAAGSSATGQTLGLREAGDVRAAIELLRRRPFIDPTRIAVVGIGTGANAALLNLSTDPRIAGGVLIAPLATANDAVARHVLPRNAWLRWMTPICKWTFEIAYQVDADELNVSRYEATLRSRPILVLARNTVASEVDHAQAFLKAKLIK